MGWPNCLAPSLNSAARASVSLPLAAGRADCTPIFLRGMADRFVEMNRLADLSTHILEETGEFIHAMPYCAGSYDERTPLMHEIRADGIDL